MSFFDWISKLVSEYWPQFLNGTKNTLIMALTGTVAGFVIGLLIAIVRTVPVANNDTRFKKIFFKSINALLCAYIEIIRGTPMLVQALIIHYSLFVKMGMPSLLSAIIIISFNTGAYMAEILRGGINAVDIGQMEASRSLGFGFAETMFRIILPQAIKNILPTLGNEFIALLKETSIVSFIAVMDVTKALKSIAESTYEYFVPYIVLALVYLSLVLLITWLIKILERRLAKSDR